MNCRKTISLISFAALLYSCSSRELLSLETGGFRLSARIETARTKAVAEEEELLNSSRVNIYNGDFSGLVRTYRYSEAPETIYLPVNSYRVDVIAGEAAKDSPAAASWSRKSYAGSADFDIVPGTTGTVQVAATISNAVTKVTFDPTVADNFEPGYTFTVGLSKTDAAQQLVYDASKDSAEGYFILSTVEPSLYWSFSGTLSADGSTFEKEGEIPAVSERKLYKMSPAFTIHDGELSFTLKLDRSTEIISDMIVFEPKASGLRASSRYEIWAGHATVHADVDESEYGDVSKLGFKYRTASGVWTYIDAQRDSEGDYSAKLSNLTGNTEYVYRLVYDGAEIGDSLVITTESAPQLPNWDFETTSNAEGSRYKVFYDPESSDPSLRSKFWDSGNSASADFGYVICNSSTDVPPGFELTKSAVLSSRYALVKFAAGNLFTGEFAGLSAMNGKVNFGRPWTSRPTAVRFWYKYSSGKVNHGESGVISTDEYDLFSIRVALGTWSNKTYGGTAICPVQVNTGDTGTFWDFKTIVGTIAYCEYEERADTTSGEWAQITIPLEYGNESAYPSHIIVSCASSKYGDYFAGYDNSQLWIDNFELIYE